MALFRDDAGKTEQPTPGRLGELRDKGDTNLSKELVTAGSLLTAVIALHCCGGWLMDGFSNAMTHGLRVDLARHPVASGDVPGACREIVTMLWLVAPPALTLFGIIALSTAVCGYAQIGFRFSTKVLGFKLERINPFANWTRIFNMQAVVRTALAALKLLVLGGVLWLVLRNRWGQLALLNELEFPQAVQVVADLVLTLFLWVAVIVLALSVADLFWQRFDFINRNMMTKQEVEDERKRAEGDPLVKSKLKQARNELMRQRMMQAVPKADVVITNPTHYSIAIKYDRRRNAAPEVVAKGVDDVAMRIRELAREHQVPLMEDPPLARALFRAVRVGQEVPTRFYQAVATILSHVYRLKGRVA